MKLLITPFLFILLIATAYSQNLTGIWRGTFVQKEFNPMIGRFVEDTYKFEVQINHHPNNNAIEGVTYSYKTVVFYGKAAMDGIYTPKTKNILIKETKLLDSIVRDMSNTCLMTCYLDYSKKGNTEILSGTYTSIINRTKNNCGEGTVYLEKVTDSEFGKEAFLLKKKPANIKTGSTEKGNEKAPTQNTIKPGAEDFVVGKKAPLPKATIIEPDTIHPKIYTPDTPRFTPPIIVEDIVPKVLLDRGNKVLDTIIVKEADVHLDFYDNGVIDNDSISVYDNHQLIIGKSMLSDRAITYNIHFNKKNETHEVTVIAENLGTIPPNTALMVITSGKQRHEVYVSTDEKQNATVVLKYVP